LVESVRIVDVIPGKPVIGLEIPNAQREMIGLKEILSSNEFNRSPSMLTMGLGKDINGQRQLNNFRINHNDTHLLWRGFIQHA
jgi:DNA segregation ATPase FtsK/SpoIIIE-like protein